MGKDLLYCSGTETGLSKKERKKRKRKTKVEKVNVVVKNVIRLKRKAIKRGNGYRKTNDVQN